MVRTRKGLRRLANKKEKQKKRQDSLLFFLKKIPYHITHSRCPCLAIMGLVRRKAKNEYKEAKKGSGAEPRSKRDKKSMKRE